MISKLRLRSLDETSGIYMKVFFFHGNRCGSVLIFKLDGGEIPRNRARRNSRKKKKNTALEVKARSLREQGDHMQQKLSPHSRLALRKNIINS